MCMMQIPEADLNELSKTLERGSRIRTHVCLGDVHGFAACSFLSWFTYGRNMMAGELKGLVFKQAHAEMALRSLHSTVWCSAYCGHVRAEIKLLQPQKV